MLLFRAESEAKVIFTGQSIIFELLKISILTIIVALERGREDCYLPFGN